MVMGPVVAGQQVAFAVVEGNNGPIADNVVPFAPAVVGGGFAGGSGYVRQARAAAPPSFMGAAPPSMMSAMMGGARGGRPTVGGGVVVGMAGGRGQPKAPRQDDRFFGTVRTYTEEKGWGHIDCLASNAIYGKDIFLLRSAVAGLPVEAGSLVAFNVAMTPKGPQAAEVTLLPAGAFSTGGEPGGLYQGIVKSFKEEKGWGFATSDDIQKIFGKDIFLHRRELKEQVVKAGDAISFSVEQGPGGQLEAKHVTVEGSGGGELAGDDGALEDGEYGVAVVVAGRSARAAPY